MGFDATERDKMTLTSNGSVQGSITALLNTAMKLRIYEEWEISSLAEGLSSCTPWVKLNVDYTRGLYMSQRYVNLWSKM
jgi:hypothetical protein